MLLGCTVMLMHCPMLSAKRYGSAARSQLSRGEHLAHTGTRQHTRSPSGTKPSGHAKGTRTAPRSSLSLFLYGRCPQSELKF